MRDETPEITPALSAEEWREIALAQNNAAWLAIMLYQLVDAGRVQSAAALCLYGQPFGFTHEDVRGLRSQAQVSRAQAAELRREHPNRDRINPEREGRAAQLEGAATWYESLASRLAALLPPTADDGTPP